MNKALLKIAELTHERRVRKLSKVRSQLKALRTAFGKDKLVEQHLKDVDAFLDLVLEDWKIHVHKLNQSELISSPWFGNNH